MTVTNAKDLAAALSTIALQLSTTAVVGPLIVGMPRTAASKKKLDPNQNPLSRWAKLPHHDKFICWRYHEYIITEGKLGWNPSEGGSVHHQRSSNYLLSLGSDSWFRHRAKGMVTLAQRFAELNETPPEDPTPKPPPKLPQTDVIRATFASPPPSPIAPPRNRAIMNSPGGRRSAAPSVAATPAPAASAAATEEDLLSGLVVPTSFGMYKKFNYTTRKTTTEMQCRLIVHNGVTVQDIEFEWVTPRILKIGLAWPDWFQNAEQMAQFTLDEDGTMLFPPEHPLTMDTSERNQALVEEDGRIWDHGVLVYEVDMKMDDPKYELLEVEVPGGSVKVLQIFVW